MKVSELLATHTSWELAEWQAFDVVHGFGDARIEAVLADIHEQLQMTNHLLGAAHFTPEDEPEENPIPPPTRYPRGGDRPQEDPED